MPVMSTVRRMVCRFREARISLATPLLFFTMFSRKGSFDRSYSQRLSSRVLHTLSMAE